MGVIRSLVNARRLLLKCANLLHEELLVLVLMYESETGMDTKGIIQDKGCKNG